MKTLLLLLALVLALVVAGDKIRNTRTLMIHPEHPELPVGPAQLVSEFTLATFNV